MRNIKFIPKSKKEQARKLLYDYLIELSEFDPDIKFDKNKTPIYKWFDCYWEDENRYPIFLLVDKQIAGMALIRGLENNIYEIAEFYVLPEFRKDGNSLWFACEVAKRFEGEIEFSTRFTNPRALKFWNKFANIYESNSCFDDQIWRNWKIQSNLKDTF